MKSKLSHAVAGLALALILALVGASPSNGSSDTKEEAGSVVPAASDSRTAVTTRFDRRDASAKRLLDLAEAADNTHKFVRSPYANQARDILPEPKPAPAAQDESPAPAVAQPEPAAEPEPAPAPAPTGGVEGIIQRYFGPNTSKALAVARCESGLNPAAMSPGGGNHGLFQINNVHSGTFESVTGVPWSGRYDAEANTRFAKWLFDQSGWGPWACA